jgi:hypothetical protein
LGSREARYCCMRNLCALVPAPLIFLVFSNSNSRDGFLDATSNRDTRLPPNVQGVSPVQQAPPLAQPNSDQRAANCGDRLQAWPYPIPAPQSFRSATTCRLPPCIGGREGGRRLRHAQRQAACLPACHALIMLGALRNCHGSTILGCTVLSSRRPHRQHGPALRNRQKPTKVGDVIGNSN